MSGCLSGSLIPSSTKYVGSNTNANRARRALIAGEADGRALVLRRLKGSERTCFASRVEGDSRETRC